MKVEIKERVVGKGHFCIAIVSITNRYDVPTWFVTSGSANEFLPYSGQFASREGLLNSPFGASAYDERHGRVIIVDYYGTNHFKGILLPPRGHMRFEGFMFKAFSEPPRYVDLWEVKRLLVNGKTPLQEWLPYAVESSTNIFISGRMYSGNQVNVSSRHEKQYPDEKVEHVKAETLKRYVVPLPE